MDNPRFIRNVIVKAAVLFFAFNLIYALTNPLPALGQISAYNLLFPGRTRLPYGEDPGKAYNLSLFQLDAMFASHEISAGRKPMDEYRVLLIGDSATWGFLLKPEQTLSAALNTAGYRLPDGRQVRAYNLGYPVMSLAKDLLILSYALRYEPDLIVWPVTLESFPYDKQLFAPLLQHNLDQVDNLIRENHLSLELEGTVPEPDWQQFWRRTLVGQRRNLADLLRLQFYGVMWAATGIDQDIPEKFTLRMDDLPANQDFHNLAPPHLSEDDLAFEVLEAGRRIAGDVPVLIVNEPMFISQGENSDIRYNFYYPRWAYDDYRKLLAAYMEAGNWLYHDFWDLVAPAEFTNTAVHMSPEGTRLYAEAVGQAILEASQREDNP